MKTIKKSIVALFILVGVVLRLSPVLVICATNPVIVLDGVSNTEYRSISSTIDNINYEVGTVVNFPSKSSGVGADYSIESSGYLILKVYNNSQGSSYNILIEVNVNEYNKLSSSKKRDVMDKALTGVLSSTMSRTNRTKVYNFIADTDSATSNLLRNLGSDVRLDLGTAYSMIRPWSGRLGTILAYIVLLLFVSLGATLIIDISWITLPMLQYMFPGKDNKKPIFVSIEAFKSVKQAEDMNEYKNSLLIYLRNKTGQLIAVALCLLYIVSGELFDVLASVMDLFSGLLNA